MVHSVVRPGALPGARGDGAVRGDARARLRDDHQRRRRRRADRHLDPVRRRGRARAAGDLRAPRARQPSVDELASGDAAAGAVPGPTPLRLAELVREHAERADVELPRGAGARPPARARGSARGGGDARAARAPVRGGPRSGVGAARPAGRLPRPDGARDRRLRVADRRDHRCVQALPVQERSRSRRSDRRARARAGDDAAAIARLMRR